MAHADISLDIAGAQARITLNRPDARNALRMVDIKDLTLAVKAAGTAAGVTIVRLRSTGDVFCSGRAAEPKAGAAPLAETLRDELVQPILDLYAAMADLDIVSLAEVQGPAHGLGCALVACCDLAIGTRRAAFTLPEMHKNLPPTLAMSALLPRIGRKPLAHLVLAQCELNADAALQVGLLGELVEPERLQQRADEVADYLAGRDPLAIKTIKRYLRMTVDRTHRQQADAAATLLASAMTDIQRSSAA